MQLKPVEEQVVALMGASSGIGRQTALQFADRGARVVVAARGEEGLNSLVEEIREKGGQATAVPAEVSDFEQVKAVAQRAVEEYGHLDSWVHLAAVGLFATFEQTTPEEFERIIQINLMGQVYGAMAALPHIKREGRGALIHISSVEAKRSFPFHSAYAASKHGIDGFLESLRVELAREGWPISVTQVMPGTINTPFFDKGRTKLGVKPVGAPPHLRARDRGQHYPLRRREPGQRPRLRGGSASSDPQPAPLPAHGRCHPHHKSWLQPPDDRGAEVRGRPRQPLCSHKRARHGEGRLQGVLA